MWYGCGMQTSFMVMRSGAIGTLPDAVDYEAMQTVPLHAVDLPVETGETALDTLDPIEIVVRFKNGGGTIVAGTFDLQILYVHYKGGSSGTPIVVGRPPVTGAISGRQYSVPGTNCRKLIARITNVVAVGAASFEVLWRRDK